MSLLQGTSPDRLAHADTVQPLEKKKLSMPSGDDHPVKLRDRINVTGVAAVDMQVLERSLARYRNPHHGRSLLEILITVVPFVGLWSLMWLSLHTGHGLYLLLAVPTAGFLVRLFMLQHDCGHGSLFRHRSMNDWLGRVIGVLTLTRPMISGDGPTPPTMPLPVILIVAAWAMSTP
jgi:hypothetical protein